MRGVPVAVSPPRLCRHHRTTLSPQTLITQTLSHANPTAITPEEYFNPNFELGNRDMGRPMELTTKTQK